MYKVMIYHKNRGLVVYYAPKLPETKDNMLWVIDSTKTIHGYNIFDIIEVAIAETPKE